jgi:2-(1,2-epoxy-1,2-dihydrophenyl)acetyl-CoA isomerase
MAIVTLAASRGDDPRSNPSSPYGEPSHRYETVNLYASGAAAAIELNRPGRMNAWNEQLGEDLLDAVRTLGGDPAVRAVLITGTGAAFSSGADLKARGEAVASGTIDSQRVLTEVYNPIIMGIRRMAKPVVAAVNGPAVGIGLSLALACDLVVAAESAYFLLAFSRIGLVPDGGSSMFAAERVGFTRAAQMALLAEPVPARQAADWGLINYAWPDEEFAGQAQALAQRLADGPTRAYAGIKRELNEWLLGTADSQLELEARTQQEMFTTSDAKEGVTAFLEKRAPRFTGA